MKVPASWSMGRTGLAVVWGAGVNEPGSSVAHSTQVASGESQVDLLGFSKSIL